VRYRPATVTNCGSGTHWISAAWLCHGIWINVLRYCPAGGPLAAGFTIQRPHLIRVARLFGAQACNAVIRGCCLEARQFYPDRCPGLRAGTFGLLRQEPSCFADYGRGRPRAVGVDGPHQDGPVVSNLFGQLVRSFIIVFQYLRHGVTGIPASSPCSLPQPLAAHGPGKRGVRGQCFWWITLLTLAGSTRSIDQFILHWQKTISAKDAGQWNLSMATTRCRANLPTRSPPGGQKTGLRFFVTLRSNFDYLVGCSHQCQGDGNLPALRATTHWCAHQKARRPDAWFAESRTGAVFLWKRLAPSADHR